MGKHTKGTAERSCAFLLYFQPDRSIFKGSSLARPPHPLGLNRLNGILYTYCTLGPASLRETHSPGPAPSPSVLLFPILWKQGANKNDTPSLWASATCKHFWNRIPRQAETIWFVLARVESLHKQRMIANSPLCLFAQWRKWRSRFSRAEVRREQQCYCGCHYWDTAQMSASKEPEVPVTVETEWQWLTLLKHKHLDPPPQSKVRLWRSGDFNIEQNPDRGHISESWLYFSPPVFFSIFPCFCFSLLESPHVLAKMRRMEGREAEGKQAVWE